MSIPLLFKRRFRYEDAGILDRTHLKFFVEDTAIQLLNDANFLVTAGVVSGFQGRKSRLFDRFSFGWLRHHLTVQYIMLGKLGEQKPSQREIKWAVAQ